MEIGRAPGYSIHDRESCLILFDTLWNWSLLSPSLKGDKVNCHGIMVLNVVDVGGSVYESLSYGTGWWFQPSLKKNSQNGNLPQIGVKVKHI